MTTSTETPRELVQRLFHGLRTRDADHFIEFMAPDAVMELPFPAPGMPERLVGREEIRAHLAERWSGLTGLEIHGIYPAVHETTDPEVFIVENDVDMTRPGADRARIRTSVNVIRVQDGQVTLFRDYMNNALIR